MKEQDKEYSSGAEKVENIAEGQNVFEDAAVGSEMQGGAANGGAREHADAAAECERVQRARIERENARAVKRLEAAKLKAESKQNKQKAKADAKAARAMRKEEQKARRAQEKRSRRRRKKA